MAFQWGNLSKGLLKDLARPAGLRVSLAAVDLSTKFGEAPNEAFVEELWPTLRDRWLAIHPVSRDRVVTELRKAGLGDTAIKINSKSGQMDYLRSCRQSARLKAIVLSAFLDEGSQSFNVASMLTDSPPITAPPGPVEKDSLGAVRQAFAEMDVKREVALEQTLRRFIYDFAQRYAPPKPDAAQQGASRLAASLAVALTASINAETNPAAPASPHRDKIVAGAHRLATQNGPSDLIEIFRRFAAQMLSDKSNGIAEVTIVGVTTALAMIAAGARAPDNDLYAEVARGTEWLWRGKGESDQAPGGPESGAADADSASRITPPDQLAPAAPGELKKQVLAILTDLLGHLPVVDGDGDIPVGMGSAGLFVRILEKDGSLPMLEVFGVLVRGIKPTPELLGDLNEANQRLVFCRLLCVDDTVVLDSYVPAVNLSPHEVNALLEEALQAADHFDSLLTDRHGGTTRRADRGEVVDA